MILEREFMAEIEYTCGMLLGSIYGFGWVVSARVCLLMEKGFILEDWRRIGVVVGRYL